MKDAPDSVLPEDQNPTSALDAAGQSRRRWLGALMMAGSLAACQTSGSVAGNSSKRTAESSARVRLPASDARSCTDQIRSASIATDQARFAAWNKTLRRQAAGRETAFVDLDAVDHNLKLVGETLGSGIDLRLVAKSLPSLELLEYMMNTACTNRIMAFAEGMVRDLLIRFGSDVDILLGRPAAVDAARRIFGALERRGQRVNPASGVRWLVDTAERMAEFAQLARERNEPITVAVELDVGLRRGGARNGHELLAMLKEIDVSEHLRFAGFMGYEGHIPFAAMGGLTPDAEFDAVQKRYHRFLQIGREHYPGLFAEPLVLNSGGSRTYQFYAEGVDTPVNEVAMGSAFFYPSNFHDIPEKNLRAATFFATPVLKRIDPAEAPFDQQFLPGLAADNPSLAVANFMTTGDFPGSLVYPDGLIKNPLAVDDTSPPRLVNMLPNQGRWLGSRQAPLGVGDFVFYQPWEADAIRWLRYLDVFRAEKLVDQWSTFQPGSALNQNSESALRPGAPV